MLHTALLVDDEPHLRKITEIALTRLGGLKVTVASSGDEALALLGSLALEDLPDVVLLDVMMPGTDGPTTLVRLRELPGGRSLPVVFTTAKTQPGDRQALMALGALGVIGKPYDLATLADQLRALVEAAP